MDNFIIEFVGEIQGTVSTEEVDENLLCEAEDSIREEILLLEDNGGSEFLIQLLAGIRIGSVHR